MNWNLGETINLEYKYDRNQIAFKFEKQLIFFIYWLGFALRIYFWTPIMDLRRFIEWGRMVGFRHALHFHADSVTVRGNPLPLHCWIYLLGSNIHISFGREVLSDE